jgi:uncharacterized protein (DUF58 family)
MGRPFVRRYREERELTLVLAVDRSASGLLGSGPVSKGQVMAELGALLALAAIHCHDKAGALLFTDRVERFIPPGRGTRHALRLIRELLHGDPVGAGTALGAALRFLGRVLHKRTVIIVLSDFQDQGYERPLRALSRRHDVIPAVVSDPLEWAFPDVGLATLKDAESGQLCLVDSGSAAFRADYSRLAGETRESLRGTFRGLSLDWMEIQTDRPFVPEVIRFFRKREARRAKGL